MSIAQWLVESLTVSPLTAYCPNERVTVMEEVPPLVVAFARRLIPQSSHSYHFAHHSPLHRVLLQHGSVEFELNHGLGH
jgi:hypothetical protein